jgi:hypothetical protein
LLNDIHAQLLDTISNWDGTNVNWVASGVSTQVIENPDQQGINPSLNCLEATTSENPYDLIFFLKVHPPQLQ